MSKMNLNVSEIKGLICVLPLFEGKMNDRQMEGWMDGWMNRCMNERAGSDPHYK